MQRNLIPANKDPKVMIKESDQNFWHVEITRKTIDPSNPKNVWSDSFIQVFDDANFNRIFRPELYFNKNAKTGEYPNYKPAALIDESRIVHDPELYRSCSNATKYKAADFEINDDLGGTNVRTDAPENHDDLGGAKKVTRKPITKK